VNDAVPPGGMFSIAGHKFKIAGNDPETCVYFAAAEDSAQRVKADGHLAENGESKPIG
jgi:hypothetical protein